MSSVDQSLGRPGITSSDGGVRLFSSSIVERESGVSAVSRPWLIAMSILSAILVPSRMLLSSGPPDDSSVYAYVGWAMKHDLMPYRDIWDHKGPLLYYLNFAGMSLRSSSTFGVGLIELVTLSITFFLLYRVITSFATLSTCIVVAAFSIAFVTRFFAGGNMTESWSLLPLALAQYACWRWSQQTSRNWCAPVISACFVCIFFIRPNIGAYPLIAMLMLFYATKKREGLQTTLKQFALASVAAAVLSIMIVAPLYRWGVFHDFVTAYFGYNAAYSGALSLAGRYLHTRQLLMLLFPTAIAILGTAGWVLAISESRKKQEVAGGLPSLYLQTLLWSLPLEIAAATLSGRDYPHYLLPLFPTFVVLAAWFFSEFAKQIKAIAARPALVITLVLGLCPFALLGYADDFSRSTQPTRPDVLAVARFIQRATTSRDKITVVETESAHVTFLAQRPPGSRFVYQLPLIDANNPIAGEQRQQFMCDIAKNRPAVIVASDVLFGILCATPLNCTEQKLDPSLADYGYHFEILPKILQTVITTQYRPVSDSRFGSLKVFLRNDISIPSQW